MIKRKSNNYRRIRKIRRFNSVKKNANSNVYDDIVRALCERHSGYLIYLVNEFFDESYTDEAKVKIRNNEHHKMTMEQLNLRITDAYFEIEENGVVKLFHLEVQSNADSSMVIRIIEYDFLIAIENASNALSNDDILELTLPETIVLQLRGKGNGRKEYKVRIRFKNQHLDYYARVEYSQAYTLDDIEDKKLYFLLPSYLMRMEDQIKNGEDVESIKTEIYKISQLLN